MSNDSGESTRTGATSTSVDLGDDLLDQTRTRTRTQTMTGAPADPGAQREIVQDDLQSAKILFGEGLVDEAKKVLRKILIGDPGNAQAKHMLGDIHNQELKQIFQGTVKRRRFSMPEEPQGQGIGAEELASIDSESLMKNLDRDLGLGLFAEGPGPIQEELVRAAETQVELGLASELHDASPRDRIDVGIGLLEIGMAKLALKQFMLAKETPGHPDLALAASSLLAQAQLQCDLPHDAIETLQLALMESGAESDRKIELVYLLGRAHEKLGRLEQARGWYERVAELDPTYRDVLERIARTAEKA